MAIQKKHAKHGSKCPETIRNRPRRLDAPLDAPRLEKVWHRLRPCGETLRQTVFHPQRQTSEAEEAETGGKNHGFKNGFIMFHLIYHMKEFVEIDATTFLMLKSPPRPARPKAPHVPLGHVWWHRHGMSFMQIPCHVIHGHDAAVMARHPVFRHDMSYMDMPWSLSHGTSCYVPISCDHDMTSSTWSRSCSPLMFNHSFLEDWFHNSFRFRRAGRLSILAVKMWNGGIYTWVLLPSTALFGQLPSHLGAIKLWGPIPPSRFLQISSLLSWSLADQGTHLSSLAFLRGPDSELMLMLHEFGTPMTGMQVHGGKRNHDSNMTHMGNMANKHEYPRSLTWQAW